MINFTFILFLLFFSFNCVNSLRLSGKVVTQDSWYVVTRFCFKSYAKIYDSLTYTFTKWSAPYLNNLFLFNTTVTLDEIVKAPLSCHQKKDLAWVYSILYIIKINRLILNMNLIKLLLFLFT